MNAKTMKKFLALFCAAAVSACSFAAPTGYTYAGKLSNLSLVCTNALQAVSGSLPTITEKKWAMFVIGLNDTTNGVYTGFEMKASTNNFVEAGTANGTLFYAKSATASTGAAGTNDRMRLYVCSKQFGATNEMYYCQITNTAQLTTATPAASYKFTDIVAMVSVDCLVRVPAGTWLSDQNEELTWCYSRNLGDSAHEMDVGGTSVLWRPVAPVRWYSSLPSWASQVF